MTSKPQTKATVLEFNTVHLLTEWEGCWTGKYLGRGHSRDKDLAQRELYAMTESQIFSPPASPDSVNTTFITVNLYCKIFKTNFYTSDES